MRASSLRLCAPLLLAAALLACISLLPLASARNSYIRSHWRVAPHPAEDDVMHRLNLALVQRNIPELKEMVARISDPQHIEYGQYLSLEEIADSVAPSDEQLAQLDSALRDAGALEVDITASRDFASVLLPVGAIHELFSAPDGSKLDLRVHTHAHSGRKLLRTFHGSPFVHKNPTLNETVQLVSGLVDFMDYPKERKLSKLAANEAFRAKSFEAVAAAREYRASPLLQKTIEAPRVSAAQLTCSNSAPDFGRIKSSHEDMSVTVIIYCQGGQATLDPINPCSDYPPAVAAITIAMLPRAHPDVYVVTELADLSCALTSQNLTVGCLFPTQDFPAWGRMHIQAQITYVDKSQSMPAQYGSGFAPSPYITPDQIFNRYNVPFGTRGREPRNSQAVVAFEEQYINVASDYKNFLYELALHPQTPVIDGQNDPSNPGEESTLDVQYISAIGQNIPTTFMSLTGSGPAKPPGDGAYILEWAMHVSNLTNPPLVTSISYGDTEDGYFTKFGDYSYIERMEAQLAIMAARGLTVLAGSGDAGASNVGEAGNDISNTDPTCSPFRAFYPSNSPYVTSVSSTFLSTNYLPVCQQNLPVSEFQFLPIICEQLGEIAVGVSQGMMWTTGGGFSNLTTNPVAEWQKDVVANYLATSDLPPAELFTRTGRAYPDVSTLGHNLLMQWNGNLTTVDGTSASGPVMAGLVSLINDYRLRAKTPPLGLINPLLYLAAKTESSAFMDVSVGHNADGDVQPKCSAYPSTCPYGFKTQPGWNPVTGLGTPNWIVLRDFALAVVSEEYESTKFD